MIKQIIKLILATLVFYAIGRLAYEHFYRLTISIVKIFSSVPINFFGKFPFWFFGDPTFGLIIASIPLTVFAANRVTQDPNRTLLKTLSIYTICFIITYLLICLLTSIGLSASNDFYKSGQELSYNLRQVNLNEIYLTTIVIATILTMIILTIINLILRYKTNNNEKKNAST